MKTEPMTIYQTEVITENITSEFYRAMYTIAKQFGAQASGNYDWRSGKSQKPNAFSMFPSEKSAEEFRQALFDSGLENTVDITSFEI